MKLNKLLALLIAVAMIFAFTACDNAANSTPTPDNTTPAEDSNQNNPGDNTEQNNPGDNTEQNNQDNTTDEVTGDDDDEEIVGGILKASYKNPGEGALWDQPAKFQFSLKGFDVIPGDTISIMILPLERNDMTQAWLRSTSGWAKFTTTNQLITEGEWAGWYEMSCTSDQEIAGVCICLTNTTPFTVEDAAVEQAVYIGRIVVAGEEISLGDVSAAEAVIIGMNTDYVEEAPVERINANLGITTPEGGDDNGENGSTEGTEGEGTTTTPSEGTEGGESTEGNTSGDAGTSTETPAEGGDAGASNGEAASTEGAAE